MRPSASTTIVPRAESRQRRLRRRRPGRGRRLGDVAVAGRGRRAVLDQLGVGCDDEPHVARALAVGVAGGGVALEVVQRPLARDQLQRCRRRGWWWRRRRCRGRVRRPSWRRPRPAARPGRRRRCTCSGVDVVGEAVEGAALGPDQDLAQVGLAQLDRGPGRRRRAGGRGRGRGPGGRVVGPGPQAPASRPAATRVSRRRWGRVGRRIGDLRVGRTLRMACPGRVRRGGRMRFRFRFRDCDPGFP